MSSKQHVDGKAYCKACNKSFYPQNRKPATTFSGLNSVHEDHIKDFPRHEKEDMCQRCLNSIAGYNNDMGRWFKTTDSYKEYKVHQEKMKTKELNPFGEVDKTFSSVGEIETMGSASDLVQDEYNGRSHVTGKDYFDSLK